MNLHEMLNAKPQRNNPCKWSQWYNNIDPADRETIQVAFANQRIETSHIVRTLQGYGCPMSESTIRTHRRNECKTCQE